MPFEANRSLINLSFYAVILFIGTSASAQTPCVSAQGTTCRGEITLEGGWRLPYWRTYALGSSSIKVVRAIIVIHGVNRNADSYFGYLVEAARLENQLDTTLIIAPHFQNWMDDPADDEIFWSDGQWKQGDRSVNAGRVSSFAVVDEIIARLANRSTFPNLTHIVITGHSAGGQFTNRYAAGSHAQNVLPDYAFQYVVTNPSSCLYLRTERPILSDPNMNAFSVPDTSCRFNDYRYGLDNRNAYMGAISAGAIQSQYRSRYVTYLLGSKDTEESDDDLDESCAANFQGFNRFERGNWFSSFLQRFFPSNTHRRVTVPNVGHSAYLMYTSDQGRSVLFGEDIQK
jgi:hypothetical protein